MIEQLSLAKQNLSESGEHLRVAGTKLESLLQNSGKLALLLTEAHEVCSSATQEADVCSDHIANAVEEVNDATMALRGTKNAKDPRIKTMSKITQATTTNLEQQGSVVSAVYNELDTASIFAAHFKILADENLLPLHNAGSTLSMATAANQSATEEVERIISTFS